MILFHSERIVLKLWTIILSLLILLHISIQTSDRRLLLPNPFPKPTTDHRTAIIISGHLRSGNISLASDHLRVYNGKKHFRNHVETRTPIQTILDGMIAPIALYGGVDLFIYIPTDTDIISANHMWNGDPLSYETTAGDHRVCELYINHAIFHPSTGNKAFCLIEHAKRLSDIFIENFTFWKNYYYDDPAAKEMYLQQEYGKYRGNLACKEYALSYDIRYTYKIRLRPDDALIAPFPSLASLSFRNTSTFCPHHTIFYPNSTVFGFSSIDSFNIGEADEMDKLLDRYLYMITKPLDWKSLETNNGRWNAERSLRHMMKMDHSVCMRPHRDILMTKLRKVNYTRPFNYPKRVEAEWILMPAYKP